MGRSFETTHRIMSAIPSKDTRPEKALRRELWRRGLRFRKNYKGLPGKPDVVFTRVRIVVFCDGDFWHGHNWAIRGYGSLEEELKRYSVAWREKIQRNIARDKRVTEQLTGLGWTVIRIWESEIKADVATCGDTIEYAYWNALRNIRKDYKRDWDADE